MGDEVRYHLLRPNQIVKRRKECPVAYLPVGTLEWHGLHNPIGADGLQAEAIAIRCAEKGGGLAFPPMYYGESRSEQLMEADQVDREKIAECMQLPAENFSPRYQYYSPNQQTENYGRLLLHTLTELETLGFKVGVLVAGHYPLYDHCRAAVLKFSKRSARIPSGRMIAWTFTDYVLLMDAYKGAGDHAAGWETSHLLAIAQERVDMELLPPKGKPVIGVFGTIDVRDANAEFGRETIEAAVDLALKEVDHRLRHPEIYDMVSMGLMERLWSKE